MIACRARRRRSAAPAGSLNAVGIVNDKVRVRVGVRVRVRVGLAYIGVT